MPTLEPDGEVSTVNQQCPHWNMMEDSLHGDTQQCPHWNLMENSLHGDPQQCPHWNLMEDSLHRDTQQCLHRNMMEDSLHGDTRPCRTRILPAWSSNQAVLEQQHSACSSYRGSGMRPLGPREHPPFPINIPMGNLSLQVGVGIHVV